MATKRISTLEISSCVLREGEVSRRQQRRSRPPIEVSQSVTPHQNRRSEVHVPLPLCNTTTVFAFGSVIIFLASIWTPLALVVVWISARLQRYWFRVNDEPTARRKLLKEFIKKDQLTAPLRYLPDHVHAEESYWVNRRYVFCRFAIFD
jgi:hypothetical protein